jgi:hypothetical protein
VRSTRGETIHAASRNLRMGGSTRPCSGRADGVLLEDGPHVSTSHGRACRAVLRRTGTMKRHCVGDEVGKPYTSPTAPPAFREKLDQKHE